MEDCDRGEKVNVSVDAGRFPMMGTADTAFG